MVYFVICTVALIVSALTLFSGFGLGTLLMPAFAILELSPRFVKLFFDMKYIPLGGALSGFFGGLSGQQGALRSAFLIRTGLNKEAFIGISVISAVMVDVSRLIVYISINFFYLE